MRDGRWEMTHGLLVFIDTLSIADIMVAVEIAYKFQVTGFACNLKPVTCNSKPPRGGAS